MNKICIVDNFLSEDDFQKISSTISSEYFPWYYSQVISKPNETTNYNAKYNFQFIHNFYKNYQPSSDLFYLMLPLVEKINPKSILRIKANLTTKTDEVVEHGYHIDFKNAKTCVFYLNTNNGYTKFKDNTVVDSVENRAIFFDSNLYHTGTTSTDVSNRMVININYIGQFNE